MGRSNLVAGAAPTAVAAPPGGGFPTPRRRGSADFMDEALCRRFDPLIWDLADEAQRARHLCVRHCPVVSECRAWARRFRWHECVVGGERWAPRGDTPAARPVGGGTALAAMLRLDCLLCQTPEAWSTPSSRASLTYPFLHSPHIPATRAGAR